uniref:SURF1 family cytochrome oxidase biogenesis protein n=1 Tax=Cellulomonas endophytica TaxID=2494735 RepID=UPI0013E97286
MSPARRRAAGLVALALVLAVSCTFLGRWQWHRHEARSAAVAVVERNWRADPVPLDAVLRPGRALTPAQEWRRVTVTGTYDGASPVLLRNRPVDGTPAYHVVAPFREDGTGAVLLVDRGWVRASTGAVAAPASPAGPVTLTVRLRPLEPASGRAAPAGQVQAIALDEVLAAAGTGTTGAGGGTPAYAAFGSRVQETPAAAGTPADLPPPDTDLGSHLSYAFQWWVFAAGALVAFGVLARRELLEERVLLAEHAEAGDEPLP